MCSCLERAEVSCAFIPLVLFSVEDLRGINVSLNTSLIKLES